MNQTFFNMKGGGDFYYSVYKGNQPGIYDNVRDLNRQIENYNNPIVHKFPFTDQGFKQAKYFCKFGSLGSDDNEDKESSDEEDEEDEEEKLYQLTPSIGYSNVDTLTVWIASSAKYPNDSKKTDQRLLIGAYSVEFGVHDERNFSDYFKLPLATKHRSLLMGCIKFLEWTFENDIPLDTPITMGLDNLKSLMAIYEQRDKAQNSLVKRLMNLVKRRPVSLFYFDHQTEKDGE